MVVLQINSMLHGSTGKIVKSLAEELIEKKHVVYIAVPKHEIKKNKDKNIDYGLIKIGNLFDFILHHLLGRLTGLNGCFSYFVTRNFLNKVDKINPDIVHIHNLHNCFINIGMLTKYLKLRNISVVWTLHDCWAFTGQCAYFSYNDCNKWEKQCKNCPQISLYPKSWVDNTYKMYLYKKEYFLNISNCILVAPSFWLENLVKKSFLKDYCLEVIHNGIDLNLLSKKYFIDKNKITTNYKGKFVILGVANKWDFRKGIDVFNDLAVMLDENKYQIIMVGVSKLQKKKLSNKIITISRIEQISELMEIYKNADVFINPTREDNFPLVNLESLASGIPVITFNTGGSIEAIDNTCGIVTSDNTSLSMYEAIVSLCKNMKNKEDCKNMAKKYSIEIMNEHYMEIYNKLLYRE